MRAARSALGCSPRRSMSTIALLRGSCCSHRAEKYRRATLHTVLSTTAQALPATPSTSPFRHNHGRGAAGTIFRPQHWEILPTGVLKSCGFLKNFSTNFLILVNFFNDTVLRRFSFFKFVKILLTWLQELWKINPITLSLVGGGGRH